MVTVILARHGETDASNKTDLIEAYSDTSLNAAGRLQALARAHEIKDKYPDFFFIYSSPLLRTRQTAEIYANVLGVPYDTTRLLLERNFGTLEGMSWPDVEEKYGKEIRERDRRQEYDYRIFGGESVKDVRQRIESFKAILQSQYDNKILVAVTHGGIFRLLGFNVSWTASGEYTTFNW